MVGYQKLPDDMNTPDIDRVNGFESFQSQLDAFLEQEKEAMAGAEQDASELQRRLDHFINNFQHKLDTLVEENPAAAKVENGVVVGGKPEPVRFDGLVQTLEQVKLSPIQLEKKQRGSELPVMAGTVHSVSYSKLISSVLIGASCVIAVVLWFVWPIEQGLSPQVRGQQLSDAIPTIVETSVPVHETNESVAKSPSPAKPIAPKQTEIAVHTALAKPEKMTVQTDAPVTQTTVVKAISEINVTLTVIARIGNIRNAPDLSGKVLYRLAQGAVVTKLAEQKGWYQVRLRNGTIAWAHRSIF